MPLILLIRDNNPEKRLTVEQIRKLRRHAAQETSLRLSIVRWFVNTYAQIKNNIGLAIAKRERSYCDKYGHVLVNGGSNSYLSKCKFCDVESRTIEELPTSWGSSADSGTLR